MASRLFRALDFATTPPSVANLPALLTINSHGEYPSLRFKGEDADSSRWPAWTYGGDLELEGQSPAPTYNAGSPLLGAVDDSVKFNNGGYYMDHESDTFADIGTDDFVIEVVFRTNAKEAAWHIFASDDSGSQGWYVGQHTGAIYSGITSSTASVQPFTIAQLPYVWVHAMLFADRSGNATWYLNGIVASGDHSLATVTGTINGSAAFRLGAHGATYTGNQALSYIAMWHQPTWLDNSNQATVAFERHMQLCGMEANEAAGTSIPTVFTRASSAHLEHVSAGGVVRPYRVGDGWPCVSQLRDADDDVKTGYWPERAGTNTVDDAFEIVNWTTKANVVPVLDVTGPDGIAPLSGVGGGSTITESTDGTDQYHYIDGSVGAPATGWYELAMVVRGLSSGHDWCRFALRDGAWSDYVFWYFDFKNGTVGTMTQNGAWTADDGRVEDWGNGWFRLSFYANIVGEAALMNWTIADADNGDMLYTGIGADVCEIAQIQFVEGHFRHNFSDHYEARVKDILRYKGDDGNVVDGSGAISANVMIPHSWFTLDSCVWWLSDGGSTTDYITIRGKINVTYEIMLKESNIMRVRTSGNSNINSWGGGYPHAHEVLAAWDTDYERQAVDKNTDAAIATSCPIPIDLDRLDVGADIVDNNQLHGLIWDLRIYDADPGSLIELPDDTAETPDSMARTATFERKTIR